MKREETIAAQAGQGQTRDSSLVLLKGGSQSPPVFMAHGLGSSVVDLLPLASQLQFSHPIYGMQEKGTDGLDAPLERIEAMAEFHLGAIRHLQPHGPYFLIGYSLGGLVALEIARYLSNAGEQIALLALLDSYPYRNYLPVVQRLLLLARLAKRRIASIIRPRPTDGEAPSQALQRVIDIQNRAWRSFRPQFYEGKIIFVKPTVPTFLPDDPFAIWASLAKEIEIETMPGDHLGMLTTNSGAVAQALSRHLAEAGALRANFH